MKSKNVNTREQYHQRVFSCFDKTQQGKVSVSTIERCVDAIKSGEKAVSEETTTDPHTDKSMELEEFVKLVEQGDEEDKEKDLKQAFNMMYEESLQGITPKSLKRMLSLLGESKSLEECEVMISQFDINMDGIISFDEFRVMMMQ
ncbi:calcium-binding protein CML40 [Hirschfeldia incana]|nr:calcium-binding protein CML40 [Hirschfeldia incana]